MYALDQVIHLTNGEIGFVIGFSKGNSSNPQIRILFDKYKKFVNDYSVRDLAEELSIRIKQESNS